MTRPARVAKVGRRIALEPMQPTWRRHLPYLAKWMLIVITMLMGMTFVAIFAESISSLRLL